MSSESKNAAAMGIRSMDQSVRDIERAAREIGMIFPGLS